MTAKRILFLCLIAYNIIGCQYDPYAHKYVTQKPKDSELTGNYIFVRQTVDNKITNFKNLSNGKTVIPKIEINKDGTYSVINFPVFENWNPKFSGLTNTSGKWKKTVVGSTSNGNGELKDIWGISFSNLYEEAQNAEIMVDKNHYLIKFGYGDPDEGNAMIFEIE